MEKKQQRYSPVDRFWADDRGRMWHLCDGCDAAILQKDTFIATVLPNRTDEAGAWYCKECAREVASEWAVKWAEAQAHDDAACERQS